MKGYSMTYIQSPTLFSSLVHAQTKILARSFQTEKPDHYSKQFYPLHRDIYEPRFTGKSDPQLVKLIQELRYLENEDIEIEVGETWKMLHPGKKLSEDDFNKAYEEAGNQKLETTKTQTQETAKKYKPETAIPAKKLTKVAYEALPPPDPSFTTRIPRQHSKAGQLWGPLRPTLQLLADGTRTDKQIAGELGSIFSNSDIQLFRTHYWPKLPRKKE
jgi:hypothetical protein